MDYEADYDSLIEDRFLLGNVNKEIGRCLHRIANTSPKINKRRINKNEVIPFDSQDNILIQLQYFLPLKQRVRHGSIGKLAETPYPNRYGKQ